MSKEVYSVRAWKYYIFIAILSIVFIGCGTSETKKMKFYNTGEQLYQKGDYEKAARNFANAAMVDPNFAEAYDKLGQSLYRLNRIREAYGAFEKAVGLKPGLLDAQIHLGKILLLAGRKDDALAKADLVVAAKPEDGEALLLRAASLAALGREKEALGILEGLVSKNPKNSDALFLMSKIQVDSGDEPAAERTLRTLIANDGGNVAARLAVARLLEKNGRNDEAESEYKAITGLYPGDDKYKLILVGFYERAGRYEDGERILKDLVAAHPDQTEYRIYLASFYGGRKQETEMRQVLEKTIKDLPKEYEPYQMLAVHEMEKKERGKAAQLMEQFMGIVPYGPEHLKAKLFLAAIIAQDGKMEETKRLVEEVLKENPRDVAAHRMKGDLLLNEKDFPGAIAEYRLIRQELPDDIRATLALARTHLLNKEQALAEDVYKDALKIDPSSREALNMLGDIAIAKKDYRSADGYADKILAFDPASPHPLYRKGVVMALQNRDDEALPLFEKALSLDPGFTPAMVQVTGLLIRKQKDVKGAIRRVEEQIGKAPDNIEYPLLLSELLIRNGENGKARQVLSRAAEKRPAVTAYRVRLADLDRIEGKRDKAVAAYESIRKENPRDRAASLALASLYEEKGNIEGARKVYEDMVSRNPEDGTAANNLAFYYAEHAPAPENLGKAETLLTPFFEKNRDNPAFADTMGWIQFRKGDYEKARVLLEGSAGAGTELPPPVAYHLGMTLARLGNKEKAVDYLTKAVGSGENFPGKGDAEKTLKELKSK
jgi:tetratricopeptide (TPR) repeat protein